MKKYLLTLKVFTLLSAFLLVASVLKAQTRTASATGAWSNIATWGGASVPTSANDVIVNPGVTVTVDVAAACNSLTINGNGTATPGGVTISGTFSLAVTNATTINPATVNNTANTLAVGAGTFSSASLTMADVVSGNNGTDVIFSISTGTATISGSITMNSPDANENFVNVTGAGTLNVGSISTTGTFSNSATSTINYTGGASTIRPASYFNLTLSGTGAKTVSGVSIVNNGTLSLQGTATTTGTSVSFGNNNTTLEYAGSAAQTTSDAEYPTANGPVVLKINNSNGVTLHAARTQQTLTLANGALITTATNILNIPDGGTATSASSSAFVDGPLSKTGNDVFTFPVGKTGAGVRTIAISAPTNINSVFTAQFFRGDAHTLGTIGAGLYQISYCEYWSLANTGTASNATVTISWSSLSNCGGVNGYVNNLGDLRVAHLVAGTWANEGGVATGNATTGNIPTAASIGTFGNFALATSTQSNPLPVMFSDVKAFEKNNGVQIDWTNLTERDLISYVVERSTNGVNFTAISQQAPRSNTNDKETYSSFDGAPNSGANYYRVKVLEISGKVIYSKVMRVDIGRTGQSFTLYPNPVIGGQVSVSLNNKPGQYTLKVMTSSGHQVYSLRIAHQGGSLNQTVELPGSVKPGVYNMVISGDGYQAAKMFVVQ